MTFRWQYQAYVEPVKLVVAGEDVTLDMWWMPTSTPVWVTPPLVAEGFIVKPLEAGDFTVGPSAPDMVTWFQPTSTPIWIVPPLVPTGEYSKALDPDGFAIHITLDDATWDSYGQVPEIRAFNVADSTKTIIFTPVNDQTINGRSNYIMETAYGWVRFTSDGTNWMKAD